MSVSAAALAQVNALQDPFPRAQSIMKLIRILASIAVLVQIPALQVQFPNNNAYIEAVL
jgi:hypothetical protein